MTVMNTSYSTIEEAWGGDIAGRPTRKNDQNKKKKPPADPICDLYESKISSSSYNETDLVKFANEYYDKFDKSKYQRNMKTQPLAYEDVEREPSPKNLVIAKGESRYDVSDKKKPSQDYPLFQKQFEMKLPPLYDGGECPSITQEEYTQRAVANSKPVSGYVYAEWDDKPKCRRPISSEDTRGENAYSERIYDEDIYQENCSPEQIYQERYERRPSSVNSENSYTESDNRANKVYPPQAQDDSRDYYKQYMGRRFKEEYDEYPTDMEERRNRFFDDYEDPGHYQSISKKRYSNLQVLDLILYIISGIILIFLLEQFVRIGINISH